MNPNLILIGEYATPDARLLSRYTTFMDDRMMMLDFPLLSNLVRLSKATRPDLRTMFRGALSTIRPNHTVTFVTSHDSQDRGREVENTVAPWLLPMAYAWTLLSQYGGLPIVFWGDIYGVEGPNYSRSSTFRHLSKLLLIRNLYAYGTQRDYFVDASSVAFTRSGIKAPDQNSSSGLAVVMTCSKRPKVIAMSIGKEHANERWINVLDADRGSIRISASGLGAFVAPAGGLAVYLPSTAPDIQRIQAQDI